MSSNSVIENISQLSNANKASYILENFNQLKEEEDLNKIIKNTFFQFYNIQTWSGLYQVAKSFLDYTIVKPFDHQRTPSLNIVKAFIRFFDVQFKLDLTRFQYMIHILNDLPESYLIYCLARWSEEYKNDLGFLKKENLLDSSNFKIIHKLINNNIQAINNVEMIDFFPGWHLSQFPIYLEKSHLLTLALDYCGMGYYYAFTISLNQEDIEKPFFFRLDGGSNDYERNQNFNYFNLNKPRNKWENKMLNFQEAYQLISNKTSKGEEGMFDCQWITRIVQSY